MKYLVERRDTLFQQRRPPCPLVDSIGPDTPHCLLQAYLILLLYLVIDVPLEQKGENAVVEDGPLSDRQYVTLFMRNCWRLQRVSPGLSTSICPAVSTPN